MLLGVQPVLLAIAASAAMFVPGEPTDLPVQTSFAAGDGWLVWSMPEPGLDPKRRYGLYASHGGRVLRLAVQARAVVFDAAVGSDARGRTVVVYSRCMREGPPGPGAPARAHWFLGRGCDLWRYDLTRRREQRIEVASHHRFDEYEPALEEGRLAYAAASSRGDRLELVQVSLDDRFDQRRRVPLLEYGRQPYGAVLGIALRGPLAVVTVDGGGDSRLNEVLTVRDRRVQAIDSGGYGEECDIRALDPSIAPDGSIRWLRRGNCARSTLRSVPSDMATRAQIRDIVVPFATKAYARDGKRDLTLICPERRPRRCRVHRVTDAPGRVPEESNLYRGHYGGRRAISVVR
jgi:hypothetical protein